MSSFESLAAKWPSAFVSRDRIEQFTGGIMSQRYLANLDSRGLGPKNRVRVGRKVAYPVDDLIAWLESRVSKTDEQNKTFSKIS